MSKFLVKVGYIALQEDGKTKKVNEAYLIEAVSASDAEARTYQYMTDNVCNDCDITIKSIALKNKYVDVFIDKSFEDIPLYDDLGSFYDVIVEYVILDEKTGKEKRSKFLFLFYEQNLTNCNKKVKEVFKEQSNYLDAIQIKKTNITDVINETHFPKYYGEKSE